MSNGKKREAFQADLNADPFVATDGLASQDFYKTNGLSRLVHEVYTPGPSMTRQEFAAECDINTIMKRYENTGASINGLSRHPDIPAMYVDFTQMPGSLMEYQQFMSDAAASFMSLPAVVRKQFDNDPIAFCDYASDPGNLDQMRDWGLAPKPEAPVYQPVSSAPAVPPSAPSPSSAPAASPSA